MKIIFVPDTVVLHDLMFDHNGMTRDTQDYDPFSGLANFNQMWNDIEPNASFPEPLRITTGSLREAFWGKLEFINLVNDTCKYDVYVKSSRWMDLQMMFVSNEDRENFSATFYSRDSLWTTLPNELKPVVLSWIESHGNVEYRCMESGADYRIAIRDQYYRVLLRTKFLNTTPADHPSHLPVADPYDDVPF